MTPEKALHYASILSAFANGETIQARWINRDDKWDDQAPASIDIDGLASENLEFRIKPKPVTRPWTRDEVPVGSVMTEKCSGDRWLITAAVEDGLRISGGVTSSKLPFSEALERWTINGSPCGVAE